MYFQQQLPQEELVVSKKTVGFEDKESDGIIGSSTADTDAQEPDSADDENNMGDNVGHGENEGVNIGNDAGHGAEDG
eukprot:12473150-Ditylum_brightwellii.AAC.1